MLSSARRLAGIARRRIAGANVLRHAVELYGGHTEVHAMTVARIIAVSIRWSAPEGLEGALPHYKRYFCEVIAVANSHRLFRLELAGGGGMCRADSGWC